MNLKLINKKPETEDVISFIFQPDQPLNWQAGQFLKYTIENPTPDSRGNSRFFTIASAPFESNVMVTTRIIENPSTFKKSLDQMKLGDTIQASKPLGAFTVDSPYNEFVFIAGGIGITPFRSMLLDLDHNELPLNITLLYANRNSNFVFQEELDKLQKKYPLFNVYYLISPQRIDAQVIKEKVPLIEKSIFYISGPKSMVESVEEVLKGLEVPKDKIKTDYFPGYESY